MSTPETTTLLPSSPDFDAILVDLAKLSRNHLLYFWVEVGRRLSESFYHDDPELYRSGFRHKEGAFRDFVVAKSAELADLGLSEQLLRQSLRAFFCGQGPAAGCGGAVGVLPCGATDGRGG